MAIAIRKQAAPFLTQFTEAGECFSQPPAFRKLRSTSGEAQRQAIEQAYAQGRSDGQSQTKAQCEAEHALDIELMNAAHAAERKAWVEQEATKLALALSSGLVAIEHGIANATANILRPYLREQIAQKCIDELKSHLKHLLGNSAATQIVVTGPKEFVDRFGASLPDNVLCQIETGSPELKLTVNGTEIETRIETWALSLEAEHE